MALPGSILFALIFYPLTLLFSAAGTLVGLIAQRPALAVVRGWVEVHRWLAEHLLGIRTRVEGTVPKGQYLFAVKHQSMYETLEMVRLGQLPVIVIKKELRSIPVFGAVTRSYGSIAVERTAGAKALRRLVTEGRQAIAGGRSVIIFPEGTRVPIGSTPPLRSGFAALYRALGLPVVPVAVDSGNVWGRGLVKQPGSITFLFGEAIPPGLDRAEIDRRVHAAINALESRAQAGA